MSAREQIASLLGISEQPGDEWHVPCLSTEHDDAHPSASIYVGEPMERLRGGRVVRRQPGSWICYACGRSGRLLDGENTAAYLPTTDENLEALQRALGGLSEDVRGWPEARLDLYDFFGGIHPYWLGRFREDTCQQWRLGYDSDREAGTYPLRTPDGRLLGVVHRSFDTDATGWKYRYPVGCRKSELLFGYAEIKALRASWSRVVAVCEGALDAIACWEAGTQAVAILGSHISPPQVNLLNRLYPQTVILCFDNDAAGSAATLHASNVGIECFDLRMVALPTGVNDIAEATVVQRIAALASATVL